MVEVSKRKGIPVGGHGCLMPPRAVRIEVMRVGSMTCSPEACFDVSNICAAFLALEVLWNC
jgi:hypothetical protein